MVTLCCVIDLETGKSYSGPIERVAKEIGFTTKSLRTWKRFNVQMMRNKVFSWDHERIKAKTGSNLIEINRKRALKRAKEKKILEQYAIKDTQSTETTRN